MYAHSWEEFPFSWPVEVSLPSARGPEAPDGRYSEHHNNSACGIMMVFYRFFGCDLTGYCWYSCICPYRNCLFHDLHYLSFTHTTWTIKKSTLFDFGLD